MNTQTKKSGTAKMSQFGKVTKGTLPKRGKVLRLIALFLLMALILFAVGAAILWHNRTNLAESQIRKFMAKDGYDIALDVRKLSQNQITIANVVVSKDKDVFFKSKRMIVDYDLSERKALRIQLLEPYLKIGFDLKGNIISAWMKQNSDGVATFALPQNGVTIKNAVIDWRLMRDKEVVLGAGQADVSADIISGVNWTANIAETQALFNTDILNGDFQHEVFIETKDGKSFDIFGSVSGQALSTTMLPFENLRAHSAKSEFKFNFTRSEQTALPILTGSVLTGWSDTHISGISTRDYAAENINLKIDQLHVGTDGNISADWQMETKTTQIINDDMRTDLANKLTSHSAVANTPIAQYFTQTLYSKAERLLNGFAIDGKGSFASSAAGYAINLESPLDLRLRDKQLHLRKNLTVLLNITRRTH